MYMLWGGGAPFTLQKNMNVLDRKGREVRVLGDAREILKLVKQKGIKMGIASTTDEPSWAEECKKKKKN